MDSDFFDRIAEVEGFIPEEDLIEGSCDYVLSHNPADVPSTMLLRSLTKLLQEERSDLEDSVLEAAVDYCMEGCRRIEQKVNEPDRFLDPKATLSTFYSRAAGFLQVLGDRTDNEHYYWRGIVAINKAIRNSKCSKAVAYHKGSRGLASYRLGRLRSDKDLLLSAFNDLMEVRDHPDPAAHQLFTVTLADSAYWLMEAGFDANNMARFVLETYDYMRAHFEASRDLAVHGFSAANCHILLSHEEDAEFHVSEAYRNVKAVLDSRSEEELLPILPMIESIILEYANICPDHMKPEAYRSVAYAKAVTGDAGLSGSHDIECSVAFSFASSFLLKASTYEPDISKKIEDLENAVKFAHLCAENQEGLKWAYTHCHLGSMNQILYDLTKDVRYRDDAVESYRSAANCFEKTGDPEYFDTILFCNKSAQAIGGDCSKLSKRLRVIKDAPVDKSRPRKRYSRSKPDFDETQWWE